MVSLATVMIESNLGVSPVIAAGPVFKYKSAYPYPELSPFKKTNHTSQWKAMREPRDKRVSGFLPALFSG